MGAVTAALSAAATHAGAEMLTGAEVLGIDPDGQVCYRRGDEEHSVSGEQVLANVGPAVLARLLGEDDPGVTQGAQVKVNLVLRRLPRLRDDSVTAAQAFGGTFHINETHSQLDDAYRRAAAGPVEERRSARPFRRKR